MARNLEVGAVEVEYEKKEMRAIRVSCWLYLNVWDGVDLPWQRRGQKRHEGKGTCCVCVCLGGEGGGGQMGRETSKKA